MLTFHFEMKKLFLFIIFLLALSACVRAQSIVVHSDIFSTDGKELDNVSVLLLSAKDSFIVAQQRTDASGHFALSAKDSGNYILFISHPGYADYVEKLFLHNNKNSLEKISLLSKEDILKEVIVKSNAAAIRIKGDTTEFIADSFKMKAGANVEELIKKLPGFEVDKNGTIKAYGETVKKVLVDGEEFFGYDPTLVTRNFEAKMIDKVQLYNKKSNQAAFTGIDDGQKSKTVNLKLKENSRYGHFGKIDGGINTGGFYSVQGMFNSFKGKRKFSVFATAANTGLVGLNQGDQGSYGISRATVNDNGVTFVTVDSDDGLNSWSGRYDGKGIPQAISGGMHYDNKWNEDKLSAGGNWMFNNLKVGGEENIISQNNLPNAKQVTTSKNSFDNKIFRNGYDVEAAIQTGENASVEITSKGNFSNKNSENKYDSKTRNESYLLNENSRALSAETQNQYFGNSILWRKKLGKERRTISVNLSQQSSKQNAHGNLQSQSVFYNKENTVDSSIQLNQQKESDLSSNSFTTKIAYTEPLSKTVSLISNYSFGYSQSASDIKTFNKNGNNYTLLDSLLSNKYALKQIIHQGGAALNYQKGKIRSRIGTDMGINEMNQQNYFTNKMLERNFVNWYPNFSFNYAFSKQRNLTFTYNGQTQMPAISQLQPVIVNDDPLNIFMGNEKLNTSFNNSFNVTYVHYDRLTKNQKVYFGNMGYDFTLNPVIVDLYTDEQGKTTYRFTNVPNRYTAYYFISLLHRSSFPNQGLSFDFTADYNASKNISVINGRLNTSKDQTFSLSPKAGYDIKNERMNFYLSNTVSYHTMRSDINTFHNNYWSFSIEPSVGINFTKTLVLNTDLNWVWQQKTALFPEDFSRIIWNATLSKSFLKNNDLTIKLYANDILNQNIGLIRRVSSNYFIQNDYTTIKRYFMLSAIWKFNKTHGNEK